MSLTRVSDIVSGLPSDNYIINGDFSIWERGTSFSGMTGTGIQFLNDRLGLQHIIGTGVLSAAASSDRPTYAESGHSSRNVLNVSPSTAQASMGAGECAFLRYIIEGYDIHSLNGNSITYALWIKTNKTGVYSLAFRNSTADRSYVTEITINTANVYQRKLVTIPFDISSNGGTWDYNTGTGLSITICLACGSTYSTSTLDQWITGNYISSSNQVNFLDSVSNSFSVSQIKLNRGASDTPFVRRLEAIEEQLCRRYFSKSYPSGVTPGTVTNLGITRTVHPLQTNIVNGIPFPVEMRSAPSITIYSPTSGASGNVRDNSAGVDRAVTGIYYPTNYNFGYMALSTNIPAGYVSWFHWIADAEI